MTVKVIRGSDDFNNIMVGHFVKHHTVTCYLCHSQQITVDGTRRENVAKLKELGWFVHRGFWFCPKHILQDLSFVEVDL